MEGEAHIWRGGSKDKEKEGAASGSTAAGGSSQPGSAAAASQQDKGSGNGGVGEEAGGGEEPRRTKLATAIERAKAADEEPALPLLRKQKRGKKGEAQQQAGSEGAAAGEGEQAEAASGAGGSGEPQAAAAAEGGAAPASAAGASVGAAAAAEQEQPQQQAQQQQQQAQVQEQQQAQQRQPGAALESFIRPLEQMGERVSEMGERVSDMLHRHTHPQEQPQQGRAAGAAGAGTQPDESGYVASSSSDAEEQRVQAASGSGSGAAAGAAAAGSDSAHGAGLFGGLSSQAITSTIQDSVALLQRIKDSVEHLTGNVQASVAIGAGLWWRLGARIRVCRPSAAQRRQHPLKQRACLAPGCRTARCSGSHSSWRTAGRRSRGGGHTACCWRRWAQGAVGLRLECPQWLAWVSAAHSNVFLESPCRRLTVCRSCHPLAPAPRRSRT